MTYVCNMWQHCDTWPDQVMSSVGPPQWGRNFMTNLTVVLFGIYWHLYWYHANLSCRRVAFYWGTFYCCVPSYLSTFYLFFCWKILSVFWCLKRWSSEVKYNSSEGQLEYWDTQGCKIGQNQFAINPTNCP